MVAEKIENKAEEKIEKKSKLEEVTAKLRANPWIVSTIVLGLVTVVLLFLSLSPGLTGNVVSSDTAGNNFVSFINSQVGGGVTYVSSTDLGNVYQVLVSYQGQQIPVYVTKDGKYYTSNLVSMSSSSSQTQTPAEVPKSDKPVVQAFIFSYCPYGLQFEKALLPVYDLLKNKAGINIVAIGAMHGEYEHQESLRQISIEQLYGKDKLFAYLNEFNNNVNIGTCSGEGTCLNKYLPAIYAKLGIDKTKVENYMKTSAEAIYTSQGNEAASLGISGSPTFVINGVEASVSRTAESIKQAVCSAFNTAPAECSQTLSSSSPSPGFGSSSSSSSSSSATC